MLILEEILDMNKARKNKKMRKEIECLFVLYFIENKILKASSVYTVGEEKRVTEQNDDSMSQ